MTTTNNIQAMPRPMRVADKYTNDQLHKAARKMEQQGGSFASRIAAAYFYADLSNRRKLLEAFGDLFERFIETEEV